MPIPYYNPYGQVQNPYMVYPNYFYTSPIQTAPAVTYTMPQQQVVKPIEQPRSGMLVNWVKSDKEVEDEYVAPNCAAAFWNENVPVLYLKQADATGKTTTTVYDMIERKAPEDAEVVKTDYATSADFASLVGAVNNINDNFNKEMKSFASVIGSLQGDVDAIKADMYGIAGKKKTVRKTEGEEDA